MTVGCEDELGAATDRIANVTARCASFTIAPSGPVVIEVPFDSAQIPDDVAPSEVRLYAVASAAIQPVSAYLDVANKTTIATIDQSGGRFFNGLLRSGERPERPPLAFSPDNLSGLLKPDPTAGVPMMTAPQPSATGTLVTAYPLDLPGLQRQQLKPSVSVSYRSDAGYGNMGQGWALDLPSITIDTRWGVPAFDPSFETETYLFRGEQLVPEAGEYLPEGAPPPLPTEPPSTPDLQDTQTASLQLVPLAHRAAKLRPRKTGKAQFVLRRDDGLWRFNRYGDSPSDYWWEAWQEDGLESFVKVMFFGKAPGRLADYLDDGISGPDTMWSDPHAYLTVGSHTLSMTPKAQIRWTLAREVDSFQNAVDYDWERRCFVPGENSRPCQGGTAQEAFADLYLKRLVSYGHLGLEETVLRCREARQMLGGCRRDLALYEVLFDWTSGIHHLMNARSGGAVGSGDLLGAINIRLRVKPPAAGGGAADLAAVGWNCSQPFRRYSFEYGNDPLYAKDGSAKQRLNSVTMSVPAEDVKAPPVELVFNSSVLPAMGKGCAWQSAEKDLGPLPGGQKFVTRFTYNDRLSFAGQADGHVDSFPIQHDLPKDIDLGPRMSALHDLFGSEQAGPFNASLLGSSAASELTGGLYTGVAIASPQKSFSAGFRYSFASRDSYREATMLLDVTGDGVPDLVVREVEGYSVHPGRISDDGKLSFGDAIKFASPGGAFAFQQEPDHYWHSWSVEAHPFSAFFGVSGADATTIQTSYPIDMDGDGKVDTVSPGQVWYNASGAAAGRETPVSFVQQSAYVDPLVVDVSPLSSADKKKVIGDLTDAVKTPKSADHPRYDIVRYWRAPFDGEVTILGAPQVLDWPDDAGPYGTPDGVVVTIERGRSGQNSNEICERKSLGRGQTGLGDLTFQCFEGDRSAVAYRLGPPRGTLVSVKQGDIVAFRIDSVDNASLDVVRWRPEILYLKATDISGAESSGGRHPRTFLDYSIDGAGPDKATQGVEMVRASLAAVGPGCAAALTGGSTWPASEAEVGLCDAWGSSIIRYGAVEDDAPQVTAAGVWSVPKTGRIAFSGTLLKPRTTGDARLSYLLVDGPGSDTDRQNTLQHGSTAYDCGRDAPHLPLPVERLVDGANVWLPADALGRDAGRYRLASGALAGGAPRTEIFVRAGQLLCLYVETGLPTAAGEPATGDGTLGFWPENVEAWSWTRSDGRNEKPDPLTLSYSATLTVREQKVDGKTGALIDLPIPQPTALRSAGLADREEPLTACFASPTPPIYTDPRLDRLSSADRAAWIRQHPARLACLPAAEEYFALPRFSASAGSSFSVEGASADQPKLTRFERRVSRIRLPAAAGIESGVAGCWAEPGQPPLREYRLQLTSDAIGGNTSSHGPGEAVALMRSTVSLQTPSGLTPLAVTPFIVADSANQALPLTRDHLVGIVSGGSLAAADARIPGESVLQQVRFRVGPNKERYAGEDVFAALTFAGNPHPGSPALPTNVSANAVGYAVCAPAGGATLVLQSVVAANMAAGFDDGAAERLFSAEAPCKDARADKDPDLQRICPLGRAVVTYAGANPDDAANPVLEREDLTFFEKRHDPLSPAGLRGWGQMAVRYESPKWSEQPSPPIPSSAGDLGALPTLETLRQAYEDAVKALRSAIDALDQPGNKTCRLNDSSGAIDRKVCEDLANGGGGDVRRLPVFPLRTEYRLPQPVGDSAPGQVNETQACQYNPRRNHPRVAAETGVSVPAGFKDRGRTLMLMSNDDAQIASSSEVPLDPLVCGIGPDPAIWIAGGLMSASRIGLKDLHVGVEKTLREMTAAINGDKASGLRGIARASTASTESQAASAAVIVGAGISHSDTIATSHSDAIDLNGDGFPDLILDGRVLYTGPGGYFRCGPGSPWKGHTAACGSPVGLDLVRRTDAETDGGSLSIGAPPHTYPKDTNGGRASLSGSSAGIGMNEPAKGRDPSFATFGLTASLANGATNRMYDLIDMNGDGLPDIVVGGRCIRPHDDGSAPCPVLVRLNLGYGFEPTFRSWGGAGLFGDRSVSSGFGLSAGYSNPEHDGAFEGGVSANLNASHQDRVIVDINGDGLPDLVFVKGSHVFAAFNLGDKFSETPLDLGPVPVDPVGPGRTEADSTSAGGAFQFAFLIGFPPPVYLLINPNAAVSDAVIRQPVVFRDIDGDGLPDIAVGEGLGDDSGNLGFKNDRARVIPNNLGAHGLLSGVILPTNKSTVPNFSFEYRRSRQSDRDPTSRWVLASIATNRGVPAADRDGESDRLTCITYGEGLYDRFERQFLGFARVDTIEGCRVKAGQSRPLIEAAEDAAEVARFEGIRRTVRRYANGTIYESGLLLSEEVFDLTSTAQAPRRVTRNRYMLVDTALSGPDRVVCEKVRQGRTDVLDAHLIAAERLPTACRDDLRPSNLPPEVPLFERASRRLRPALVQTVRLTREEGSSNVLRAVQQFQMDRYGRRERQCDLGDVSGPGVDDEPADPAPTPIMLTALRAPVCQDIIYETEVRPTFAHGATGGGTLTVEQRNLVREKRVHRFADGMQAAADPVLPDEPFTSRGRTFTVGAADGKPLKPAAMKPVLERRQTAAYDKRTGAQALACAFVDLGADDPCAATQRFPHQGTEVVQAAKSGVIVRAYDFDAFGNMTRYVGPVGSGRTFVAKTYRYDGYLHVVEAAEETDYCRFDDRRTTPTNPPLPPAAACLEGQSELGASVARTVLVDYRHAAPTMSVDANLNILATPLDGLGRPKAIFASWAKVGSACDSEACPDLAAEPFGDELKAKQPAGAMILRKIASFDYRVRGDTGHEIGPTAVVQQIVPADVYLSGSDSFKADGGVRSLPSRTLFDQFGKQLQAITPAEACTPKGDAGRPEGCQSSADFVASGATLQDRLMRTTAEFLPTPVSGTSATGIDTVGFQRTGTPTTDTKLDGLNRPVSVTLADGNGYTFRYSIDAPIGKQPTTIPLRHRTTVRDALCVPSIVERDVNGNIRAVTEVWKPGTGTDSLGSSGVAGEVRTGATEWVRSVSGQDGAQQVYACNDDAPIDKGASALTTYELDSLDQLVGVHLPAREGATALSALAPSQTAIELGYDEVGRRVAINDPDRGFERLALDAASNVICDRFGPKRDTVAGVAPDRADWSQEIVGEGPRPGCRLPTNGKERAETTRISQGRYLGGLQSQLTYVWPTEPQPRGFTQRYGAATDPDIYQTNALGRPVAVNDNAGVETLAYDALGLPVRTSRALHKGLAEQVLDPVTGKPKPHVEAAYERDAWGKLWRTTLKADIPAFTPSSSTADLAVDEHIVQRYNVAGQVTTIGIGKTGDAPATVVPAISYDARGNVVRIAYDNGVATENRYDPRSNRLLASASRIGFACGELGAGDPCDDRPAPVLFENLAYRYDPGGNVLAYSNEPRYRGGCEAADGPGCRPVSPTDARRWGLLITGSNNAFRYDQLNRIRTAAKDVTTFGNAASMPPFDQKSIDRAAPYRFRIEETFSFLADHMLRESRRSTTEQPLGHGAATGRDVRLAYLYQDDKSSPRHAPPKITVEVKRPGAGSRKDEVELSYDGRGRMKSAACTASRGCGLDQPERRYFWNAEDTLHAARVDRAGPAFARTSRRVDAWYDRVESEYDFQGSRVYRVHHEEGWRKRPRRLSQAVVDQRVGDTLYLDPNLTVTRRANGKPQALIHLFAGAARLASAWLPDGPGGEMQLFTYHVQQGNRNVSDIVRSSLGQPTTARLHQQMEYAAFGDLVEERERALSDALVKLPGGYRRALSSREAIGLPHFRFNGKEQDETGIIDFGLRSYDSRLSMWLRPDPALLLYLGGALGGGLSHPRNFAAFQFGDGNPINRTDNNGGWVGADDAIAIGLGISSGLTVQGLFDLASGHMSDFKTYAAAGISGGLGAETGLYTGGVGGGAVAGASYSALAQLFHGGGLNKSHVLVAGLAGGALAGAGEFLAPRLGVLGSRVWGSLSGQQTSRALTSGSQVTEQMIREAMKDAPLHSQQKGGISLPRIQSYVDKLLAGEVAPPIKVDEGMIVDGNHRYVSGRLLGIEPEVQPWIGGRPSETVPWHIIPVHPEVWQ